MTVSDFTNRSQRPSPEQVRLALGPVYPLWERLTQFIHSQYQIEGKWSAWGPAELGWGLRYRWKGRSLVALYPQKGTIIAQVVLGGAEAERAQSLKLGKLTAKLLSEAPQLHDGRWLSIPVRAAADAEDVEQLLLVKVRPVQRTE
jgi:hypothetical protein